MRYIFLLILIYFAFKAAGNLLEAVREDGKPREKLDRETYDHLDIDDAEWEDIE